MARTNAYPEPPQAVDRFPSTALGLTAAWTSHGSKVRSLASHGRVLASIAEDGELVLWTIPGGDADRRDRWFKRGSTSGGYVRDRVSLGSKHVMTVAVNSRRVAVGGSDNIVMIYDMASKGGPSKVAPQILKGHDGYVSSLQFAPGDESCLVSGSGDSTLIVWLLPPGGGRGTIQHRLSDHNGDVTSLAFARDGRSLVSGSCDTLVKRWDASDWTLASTLKGHESDVNSVSTSGNGELIASGSTDWTVRVWLTASGECTGIFRTDRPVTSVAFPPNDNMGYVLAFSTSGELVLWNWPRNQCAAADTGDDSARHISSVAWSADCKHLFAGSWDASVKVLDTASFSSSFAMQLSAAPRRTLHGDHERSLQTLAGRIVDHGDHLEMIDDGTGDKKQPPPCAELPSEMIGPTTTWQRHTQKVSSMTAHQSVLASVGQDGELVLWDVPTDGGPAPTRAQRRGSSVARGRLRASLRCKSSLKCKHVMAVAMNDDQIAIGGSENTVMIYDRDTLKLQSPAPRHVLTGHESYVSSIAYQPGVLNRIISGSGDATVIVWDLSGKGTILHKLSDHTGDVMAMDFARDGQILVTGSTDTLIKVWDTVAWNCTASLKGHESDVNSVSLSANHEILASGSEDATVRIWLLSSGACLSIFRAEEPITSVAVEPTCSAGRIVALATSSSSEPLCIWNWTENCFATACLTEDPKRVTSLVWKPDGSHLFAGAWDTSIRIIEAAKFNGVFLTELRKGSSRRYSAGESSSSRCNLATCCAVM